MLIKGTIQILLPKSKEERTEVISIDCYLLLLHTNYRKFGLVKYLLYLLHNYDVTNLENISITF